MGAMINQRFLGSVDRVHDNNNLINIRKMGGLVDTTSYCKSLALLNVTLTA